ncbi:TPA: DNA-directed RNA polymerase subunit alpha [Candidatus Uhrbacteria bacterium]|nr:DNA-directed RNA polymerase subunit alpha [Candidatus Uhrbacteria bacterium]
MENILLPSKMYFTAGEHEHEAILTIEPLHHGYGTTVGNALRRVLLSSLPGAAVTAMKIKGVQHEFAAITGVKEDGLEIMLNLKQLRLKVHSEEPVTLKVTANKPGVITAADISANADVEIMNPDLVLCTLTDSINFEMDIVVSRGRGYMPTEEREVPNTEIGMIGVDAMFSPVRQCGIRIENTRVGEITNYDKVIMNIITDGTVTAQEAVEHATKILLNHFTWIQSQLSHASLTEQIAKASDASAEG